MAQVKYFTIILPVLFFFEVKSQEKHLTIFESSEGKKTATYNEVIDYYTQLASSYPEVTITKRGLTDSGYPLHLIRISTGEGEKLRLLINNGIHPGEPDGIDASMMLARDLINKSNQILVNFDVYIIPVYNIGGALNRNSTSRVNQDGPEEHGFRGNARNYDLNRDFIKADTRNSRSFYEIFHEVHPDIFIDTHVSNGADYQYNNTHLFTQHNKINSETGVFLHEVFMPSVVQSMESKGDPMTPYVNVFNRTPDTGFSQFMDWPRYSTGYAALFNTLGMMIETHMLKPYDVRVRSTYNFLMSALEVGQINKRELMELRDNSDFLPEDRHPLDWKLNDQKADTITFLGYEGELRKSNVTGMQRLYYNHEKPFSKEIPYYNYFEPGLFVGVPTAYVVPQGWHGIIDLLLLNKVKYIQIERDTVMEVEVYRIKTYKTSNRPYEGHYPHSDVEVEKEIKPLQFRKGDYLFPVNQYAGRYLMEVLEPQGHDSFFAWNFFDTILQRKEGFSPYVFEEIAEELLKNDLKLKAEFDAWKADNEDFRENWLAQLQFVYEKSKYAEQEFMRYPVFRLP